MTDYEKMQNIYEQLDSIYYEVELLSETELESEKYYKLVNEYFELERTLYKLRNKMKRQEALVSLKEIKS